MPVTLRRHAATAKVNGKRIVTYPKGKEAILVAREIAKEHKGHTVFSRTSNINRAKYAAEALARTMGKRNKTRPAKYLGFDYAVLNEPAAMELIGKKFAGDEIAARNAWLKGDTLNGTMRPAKEVAENIIRMNLGLGLAAEAGAKSAGRKPTPMNNILLDNVTHSWVVESVVQRLTKGIPNPPKVVGLPKENTGMYIRFVKQPSGRFKVKMSYEEFFGDVTKNFAECMLPSMKKYLEM